METVESVIDLVGEFVLVAKQEQMNWTALEMYRPATTHVEKVWDVMEATNAQEDVTLGNVARYVP